MLPFTLTRSEGLAPPPGGPDHSWHDAYGIVGARSRWWAGQCWVHVPNLADFHFRGPGRVDVRAATDVPTDVLLAAYYRTALPLALHYQGVELLHASAVLTASGVVALGGSSEAGKSTLAYALSRRGYAQWADDCLAVEASAAGVRAVPLAFQVRLRPEPAVHLAAVPRAEPFHDPEPRPPQPLAALVVLHRQPEPSGPVRAGRLGPTQAFAAVAASGGCYREDRERKRRMVETFLRVATDVPVWEVRYPTGLDHLPAVLDAVEAILASPRGRSCGGEVV